MKASEDRSVSSEVDSVASEDGNACSDARGSPRSEARYSVEFLSEMSVSGEAGSANAGGGGGRGGAGEGVGAVAVGAGSRKRAASPSAVERRREASVGIGSELSGSSSGLEWPLLCPAAAGADSSRSETRGVGGLDVAELIARCFASHHLAQSPSIQEEMLTTKDGQSTRAQLRAPGVRCGETCLQELSRRPFAQVGLVAPSSQYLGSCPSWRSELDQVECQGELRSSSCRVNPATTRIRRGFIQREPPA